MTNCYTLCCTHPECRRAAQFVVSDCKHSAYICTEHLMEAIADSCPECATVTRLRNSQLPLSTEDRLAQLEERVGRLERGKDTQNKTCCENGSLQ